MIKDNNGEKIVLVSDENKILAWIGIIPKSEPYLDSAELAGIEVDINSKGKGFGTKLLNYAKSYLVSKKIKYFNFQTTPLYTANAGLYLKHANTKYTWHPKIPFQNNMYWPLVDCVMDLHANPLKIKINSTSIKEQSLLAWEGLNAQINDIELNKKFVPLLLPSIGAELLMNEINKQNTSFIQTCYTAFDLLYNNDYEFYWFSNLDENRDFWFYIFKKT